MFLPLCGTLGNYWPALTRPKLLRELSKAIFYTSNIRMKSIALSDYPYQATKWVAMSKCLALILQLQQLKNKWDQSVLIQLQRSEKLEWESPCFEFLIKFSLSSIQNAHWVPTISKVPHQVLKKKSQSWRNPSQFKANTINTLSIAKENMNYALKGN